MVVTLVVLLWVQEEAQPNMSFKERKIKERDIANSPKPLPAVVVWGTVSISYSPQRFNNGVLVF